MASKIFTRTVWILCFVSLFNDIASEMLYPILPVYLKNIGFSIFLIGLLEGLADVTSGLSKGYLACQVVSAVVARLARPMLERSLRTLECERARGEGVVQR